MGRFRDERRARAFVLGTVAAVGVCLMLAVAGVTGYAVLRRPRAAGTPEPWVATGLAQMATYQVAQTSAVISGAPTPTSQPQPQPTVSGKPSPTPGGPTGKIVYTCFMVSSDDMCIMNADGSDQRVLSKSDQTDFYGSLSPDGQLVTFASRRTGTFEAYISDLTGTNVQPLTASLTDVYAPEISPDGKQIVFTGYAGNGKQDIYVMQTDGSGVTQITTNPTEDFDPTWSPDGTRIAFTSNRTGTDEIFVINAVGTNERQVTSGSDQREGGRLDWSPDGKWIAWYAGPQGSKNLWMMPATCAQNGPCHPDQFTRLTNGGNNKAPSFSPDSQWIAFASELSGNNDIWIMRLDGTGLTQLTKNLYAEWQPRWGP